MAKHARGLARARKKGFSLVELIIVVAIMAALVASLAPAYVKYVNRSHNAVVEAAAESVLQFVKTELSDGSLTGSGVITVKGVQKQGKSYRTIDIDIPESFSYTPGGLDNFKKQCGVDENKPIKSSLIYEITVTDIGVTGHPNLQASMGVVDPENP